MRTSALSTEIQLVYLTQDIVLCSDFSDKLFHESKALLEYIVF